MGSAKLKTSIGILSYGTALPRFVVTAYSIAQAHNTDVPGLGVNQKTAAPPDQDSFTLATQAAQEAFLRLPNKQQEPIRKSIGAVWVGSESPVYAVKPAGTLLQAALQLPDTIATADLQFACKAGTQGIQIAAQYVATGQATTALAIGADTAQAEPGDVLEYTAAAGSAAYLIGQQTKVAPVIARLEATVSVATDTPDFWRRPGQLHPQHAGRFSGQPAYFAHIKKAFAALQERWLEVPASQDGAAAPLEIANFDHCVFHTPNGKFPRQVAKQLGCTKEQLQFSLPVQQIGNTYAAAVPLALANVLDHAQPGQKILVLSYGSGAGSDAFVWTVTDHITEYQETAQKNTQTLQQKIEQLQPLTYTQYRQWEEQR